MKHPNSKAKYFKKNSIIAIKITLVCLIVYFVWQFFFGGTFNGSSFDMNRVIQDTEYISSETFKGYVTGSDENKRLMEYMVETFKEAGLEPVLPNESYVQSLHALVPEIGVDSKFEVEGLEPFVLYEDYCGLTSMNGGTIDYAGDIIMAGVNVMRIEPTVMEGKVVVYEAVRLNPETVNYVKENGAVGIICCTDTASYSMARQYEQIKRLSTAGNTGNQLFVGYLSKTAYKSIVNSLESTQALKHGGSYETVSNVVLQHNITFPIKETGNVMAMVEGKSNNGEVLLITANIDNTGYGIDSGYFPGATNKATSISVLLELARTIGSQKSLPYESIVFVGFNGSEEDVAGVRWFIDHPPVSLDKTSHIHLGPLGELSHDLSSIIFNPEDATIMADRLVNIADDLEVNVNVIANSVGISGMFSDKGVSSMTFFSSAVDNNREDNMEIVSAEKLSASVDPLLEYLQHEVYGDHSIDFLLTHEIIALLIIGLLGLLSLVIGALYHKNAQGRLLGISIEEIYFSMPIAMIRVFFSNVLPYLIAVFMLSVLANINPSTTIDINQGRVSTNFSLYLTLKESVVYLRSLFSFGYDDETIISGIIEVIQKAGTKTLVLVSLSLVLATITGLIRGIYEGAVERGKQLRTMFSLVIFSVPDVLLVIIGLFVARFVAVNAPEIYQNYPVNELIIPVIVLSIIPSIYVSRLTRVTVTEELKKDYIKGAKAVGYSKFAIYGKEMLPAIGIKIVDSIPSIITLMFSNMIIVEYLFNYNGIAYYLLYLYNRHDVERFVPLAIVLGAIYLGFMLLSRLLSRLINPLKQEVKE